MIPVSESDTNTSEMKSTFQEELGEHLSDYLHLLIDDPKTTGDSGKDISMQDLSDFLLPPPTYEESMVQRRNILENLPSFASSFAATMPPTDVPIATTVPSTSLPVSPGGSVSSGMGSSISDAASLSPPTPTTSHPSKNISVSPTSSVQSVDSPSTNSDVVLPPLCIPYSAVLASTNGFVLPTSAKDAFPGVPSTTNITVKVEELQTSINSSNPATKSLQILPTNNTTKQGGQSKTTQLAGRKRSRQTLTHFDQPGNKAMTGANILTGTNILAGTNVLPGSNPFPGPIALINSIPGQKAFGGTSLLPGPNLSTAPNQLNSPNTLSHQNQLLHRIQEEQRFRNQQISLDVNSLYHENLALKESVRQLVRQRTQLQQQLTHYKGIVEMSVKSIV